MLIKRASTYLGILALNGLATIPLQANVKMPSIFGDHMVLQQEGKVPVWGTADPAEAITVTVGTHTASVKAGPDGAWRVDLDPFPNGSDPVTLTVTGKNTLKFNDVLIGDVWICSGQSNMQLAMHEVYNGAAELAKADDPQLRLFRPDKVHSLSPMNDLPGKWYVSSSNTAWAFSAAGYFFGRELRARINRPIGMIGIYVGGTPAQAWTSLDALQKDPAFKPYVDQYQQANANFPAESQAYAIQMAAYTAAKKDWDEKYGKDFNDRLKEWTTAASSAYAAGLPNPPYPKPKLSPPKKPAEPGGGWRTASVLFNGMVRPLIPYGIKGVIWYQGEDNVPDSQLYPRLFSTLIADWRQRWSEGNFPFLFVQIANFNQHPKEDWPLLREAQLKTALSVPNTAMAVTIDIGLPENIHPVDKLDVGLRLALAAENLAYGQKLIYSGPIYNSMVAQGSTIRLKFSNTASGLKIGAPPWVGPRSTHPPEDHLSGFVIAGEDKKWVVAEARIDGDTVAVSSPQVFAPVAVRYGWDNAPVCNLYNSENLPASPFRTDAWAESPQAPPVTPVTTASTAPAR
jgi:sialate O-acetylesterase